MLVGPVSSSWAYATNDGTRLDDLAARELRPGQRSAPWVRTFAPWLARSAPPEPELVVTYAFEESERDARVTFVLEAPQPVSGIELRILDVLGEVIARRRVSVPAGATELVMRLPTADAVRAVVKLGVIERSDSEYDDSTIRFGASTEADLESEAP